MAAKALEIHASALAELKSALSWYLERNETAAVKFAAEVDRAIELLGGSDGRSLGKMGQESNDADRYFLLDTQTGRRTDFANYDAMRSAASHLGVQLNLERIDAVYSRYRFTWLDVLVGFLLCLLPLVYAALLARQILMVRRTRQFAPLT